MSLKKYITFEKKNFLNIFRVSFAGTLFYFFIIFCSTRFFGLGLLDAVRDNPIIWNESFLYGIISNIGISFWAIASIIAFNSYFKFAKIKNRNLNRFFILGGTISTFLLLTDLLDFHNYFENTIYLIIVLLNLLLAFLFFKIKVLRQILFCFFIAYAFLSISMLIDILQSKTIFNQIPYSLSSLYEELFKFLGIINWNLSWITTYQKIKKYSFKY